MKLSRWGEEDYRLKHKPTSKSDDCTPDGMIEVYAKLPYNPGQPQRTFIISNNMLVDMIYDQSQGLALVYLEIITKCDTKSGNRDYRYYLSKYGDAYICSTYHREAQFEAPSWEHCMANLQGYIARVALGD